MSANPNKALWEKGDFTRIAETMRESGEALVAEPRRQRGASRSWTSAAATARPRCPRRELGARRAGRRHREQPRRGRERARAEPRASTTAGSRKATPSDLSGLADDSFDLVVSIFGAMFAPRPFDVAKEMVRVTRPGGRIVMGNWIPNDPTLVAQILKISSAYSPPPPEGFVSPMTWGVEEHVIERFARRGRACRERSRSSGTRYTFNFPGSPAEFVDAFRTYYGPTMNAFEAAAEERPRAAICRRSWRRCSTPRTPARARTPPRFRRRSCA